jgi:hypothetical protein
MSQVQPLSFVDHGNLGWQAAAPLVLPREQDAIPVSLDEIAGLALQVPIMLRVSGDFAEPAIPVRALLASHPAVLGTGGVWKPPVLPVDLLHGPFQIVPSPLGDMVLVETGALVPLAEVRSGVEPLFQSDKALSLLTGQRLARLKAWRPSRIAARKAATALQQAGCLVPWQGHKEWHLVDDTALQRLKPAAAGALHQIGALRLAHVIGVSLGLLEVARVEEPQSPLEQQVAADPFLAALREGF